MRNTKIDLLRFLGLSLIILAHIKPPGFLFQLRNFDVSLMVLVSGLAFTQSQRTESYLNYFWRRFKRLVIPAWFFLTFYFLFMSVVIKIENFNVKQILDSYILVDGIGYVWIIRVFLLVSLSAPLIVTVNKKIQNSTVYLSSLGIIYLFYELFLFLNLPYQDSLWGGVCSLVLYHSIVFSLIFAVGIRIPQLTKYQCLILSSICMSIFIILAIGYYKNTGTFIQTQAYKYPPSIYYLSYALGMSILSWLLVDKVAEIIGKNKKIESFILLVAQNSFWVYLWHIQFIKLFEHYHLNFPRIARSLYLYFPFRYILIYLASIITTFIQVYIVKKVIIPVISKDSLKKNIKIFFTG